MTDKDNYEMALSVLKTIEFEQNTPHILAGLAYAKYATEKQIPKRLEYYDEDFAKCPNCDNDDFEYEINNWGCDFCPKCGQALDWSGTDEE